jgi:guanylate kinase
MNLKIQNKKAGNLFTLSGPSGVGKTTLREALQQKIPAIRFSVSWTTRAQRPGEIKGQDYRFVSKKQFEQKIAVDGFLEWALVHNEYYGTPKIPIFHWLKKGEDVLLDIDTQGARQVKKRHPRAIGIMILPPSIKELENRLIQRRTEPWSKVRIRLKTAEIEMRSVQHFDYMVVNREVSSAVGALEIIIKAARFRVPK